MELQYRGTTYEYNPPLVEIEAGEVVGKYRGQTWQPHYLKHIPVPQPVLDLKYRGVAYETGSSEPKRRLMSMPGFNHQVTLTSLASSWKRQSLSAETALVHHRNLQRNLEHRLEVARSQGNRRLIQLLEAEREQI